jgi:LysR family hydrogen peroxide-inducible transcriptional activator
MALCDASSEPFSGKMRLGVIPTIAPYILPGLLKQLRKQHPDFRLFIREDLSDHLLDSLQHGELDVLLLALPYPAEKVETMHLFDDEFLFACPRSHPLAARKQLSTADLQQQDLLLLEDGHCLREHALEACKLKDADVTIPYQATSLNTIVQMVANGIGVTLLPQMAEDSRILAGTDVETRHFKERDVSRSIGLMWRSKTPRRAEFALLGQFIVEACGGKRRAA